MRIRNITGQRQRFGYPTPVTLDKDRWYRVPEEITLAAALQAYRKRLVHMEFDGDEQDMLWQAADGTYVFWMSPLSRGDGYGTAAMHHILASLDVGMKLFVQECWFVDRQTLPPKIAELLREPIPGLMRVGVCMATPGEFKKLPTPYRVGFTMYEADDPLATHPEWRHDCAQVDQLIVPSEYCKEVFARFVDRPIDVCPLVIDPTYFAPRKREPKEMFKFICHGTLSGRKAPLETIELFKVAFPKEKYPWVRLEFKTRLGVFGWGQNQIPVMDDPRISIIDTASPGAPIDWTAEQVRDWMYGADAYLFLSKGEGFGLPPREAAATGLPTIFTNHTGLVSLANERYNWPIRVGKAEPSPLGGDWRLAHQDETIDTMRWMVEHREEAYEKAYQGAFWMMNSHSGKAAAMTFKGIIDAIEPKPGKRAIQRVDETLGRNATRFHSEFYRRVSDVVPHEGTILDIGVGEGLAYYALAKANYDVWGVVRSGERASIERKLREKGVEPKLVELDLLEVRPHLLREKEIPQPAVIVSQGFFQNSEDSELRVILQGLLQFGCPIFVSVPSVFYPGEFAPKARLMRREEWQDRLRGFEAPIKPYGKDGRYLLIEVRDFGSTNTGPVKMGGRIIDGVWHPLYRPGV